MGIKRKNTNVVKAVDATIIFKPKPTGNIFMNGVKIHKAGNAKKTNKNAFGFF